MHYLEVFIIMPLFILAKQDWQMKLIDSRWLACPTFIACLQPDLPCLTIFVTYIVALIINRHLQEKFLGNGDLDLLAAGACWLTGTDWLLWLTLACLLQLLLANYCKAEQLPFVPSLTVSFIFVIVGQNVLASLQPMLCQP
ncbi:hypothetical protein FO438_02970 [Weissella cibaria]|nr:hypothetical protein FO438_02970 [Weissella cibaria]